MYQIFLRQFTPQGTLKAATEMIPHLADMGIKIVYLGPIFKTDGDMIQTYWGKRECLSGLDTPTPCRMNDHFKIDAKYGKDEDLTAFVNEAHKYDIRVMLDLVYLHRGPLAILLSMDPENIKHDEKGNPILNRGYFPLLNFKSRKLREHLYGDMLYFVKKFDVDGYRCDVGGEIPLDFWEEGRRRLDQIKPDFLMLIEDAEKIEHERMAFEPVYGFRSRNIIRMLEGG